MKMWDDYILVLRNDLGQVLLLAHQTWHLCIFEDSTVASQSVSLGNSTALLRHKLTNRKYPFNLQRVKTRNRGPPHLLNKHLQIKVQLLFV
jgi:hypothetical protein